MKGSIAAGSRYVAIGSSFAAGPGVPSRVPGSPLLAGRSSGNYAHLVAAALGLDLDDVSYSGATTADILRTQLDAVTATTSLVTITAGGNDVGFLGRLTLASLPRLLRTLPPIAARIASFGDPGAVEGRFAQLASNLATIADRLRRQAPACRVLAVDYLTILPPVGHDSLAPMPPAIAEWGRGIATRLADAIRGAAGAAGWDYVSASAASVEHHAWSVSPWTQRFRYSLQGGAPYHPNATGMAAVAGLVQDALLTGRQHP